MRERAFHRLDRRGLVGRERAGLLQLVDALGEAVALHRFERVVDLRLGHAELRGEVLGEIVVVGVTMVAADHVVGEHGAGDDAESDDGGGAAGGTSEGGAGGAGGTASAGSNASTGDGGNGGTVTASGSMVIVAGNICVSRNTLTMALRPLNENRLSA